MIVITVAALLATLSPVPQPQAWQVDLAAPVSSSEMSLVDTQWIDVYQPHTLSRPANTFTATVDGDGDAAVDVRGREPHGGWTEWTQTPAVLPYPTGVVQVRVVRTGEVRALTMHATTTATTPPDRTGAGLTYELYATREGLVGGRTANGHIIVQRDHFVALPSRRGLAMKAAGDYTAKVCAKNGRCEWAPVWDVGPWNTKDDYWNPAGVRQMWTDLPQGRPQAQAAKQHGHNGGRDQFGRIVRNPAGIDLADGTFWDGLKLTTNSWVTVTFQWTGSGPTGTVRAGEPVNVRAAPRTDAPIVGLAAVHARVRVECQQAGEPVKDTDLWYRLAPDMWITAAYVGGVSGTPTC